MVKLLNEYPTYGYPHCYLQCKEGEPTAMLGAVKYELIRHKTKTVESSGSEVGLGVTPAYNTKGNFSGVSPVITATGATTSTEVERCANIIALGKLAKLELQQALEEKEKQQQQPKSRPVQP